MKIATTTTSTSKGKKLSTKIFSIQLKKKLFRKRSSTLECIESSISESDSVVEGHQSVPSTTTITTTTMRKETIRVSTLLCGSAPHDCPVAVDEKAMAAEDLPEDHTERTTQTTEEEGYSSGELSLSSYGSGTCENLDDTAAATVLQSSVINSKPDIYGQVHPHETAELIARKLVAFDKAVTKLPASKRKGVDQAMIRCPNLLDDKFKLKFLRCEVFKEKLAAKRYAKYWDMRIYVFGPERAFLPLTQHEALSEDLFALSTGFLTVTGTKDFAGRNIIYCDGERQQIGAYTTESMTRAIWYIFHAALEDEDTQKHGMIFLADLRPARLSLFDHELARVVALSVQGCIPVRLSGIHGCAPPRIFNVIFPVFKLLLGERLRKRIRLHGGSMDRVQESLNKYGLTKCVVPTEINGDVVLDHESWLAGRRKTVES